MSSIVWNKDKFKFNRDDMLPVNTRVSVILCDPLLKHPVLKYGVIDTVGAHLDQNGYPSYNVRLDNAEAVLKSFHHRLLTMVPVQPETPMTVSEYFDVGTEWVCVRDVNLHFTDHKTHVNGRDTVKIGDYVCISRQKDGNKTNKKPFYGLRPLVKKVGDPEDTREFFIPCKDLRAYFE